MALVNTPPMVSRAASMISASSGAGSTANTHRKTAPWAVGTTTQSSASAVNVASELSSTR